MATNANKPLPDHPAMALNFERIQFNRIPLYGLLGLQRALAAQMTPTQAEHLRGLIQARRQAGERVPTQRQLAAAHTARMETKRAEIAQKLAARNLRRGG